MELTEAENIFIRRSVLTFMRPQLLDRLKKNIENNLKDKLEAGSKNRTPRVIDKSELTEVNTSDSNPIADEPVEINGRGARKRRRVEYGDSHKGRWYSAVDDDIAAPMTAKKKRQIIEKSKKGDQCMKVVSRGRRNIKTKEYSSLNEVMRDVEQLSDYIKAGNERDTMLLLDAIAI